MVRGLVGPKLCWLEIVGDLSLVIGRLLLDQYGRVRGPEFGV